MKTRTALVSTLAAGLGLLACNKAADTLGPSENSTGTATLAARISAGATHADSALLRKTTNVRATLDTGEVGTELVPLAPLTASYKSGKISFPALRVGASYSLKLEGLVGTSVIWSGTLSGMVSATTSENAAKLEVNQSTTQLLPPDFSASTNTLTLTPASDQTLGAQLYWTTDTTATSNWTQGSTFILAGNSTYWIKDSIVGIVGSAMTKIVTDGTGKIVMKTLQAPTIALSDVNQDTTTTRLRAWGLLTLSSNENNAGILQYRTATNGIWTKWAEGDKLYGAKTLYVREYAAESGSAIDSLPYQVIPDTLAVPSYSLARTSTQVTVTLAHASDTSKYPGSQLMYSTNAGTTWSVYTAPLRYNTSISLRIKDSLLNQVSRSQTLTVAPEVTATVAAPELKIASAYGKLLLVKSDVATTSDTLKTGANGIDTLSTVSATCPTSGAQIQYQLKSSTSWQDGTPKKLTKSDSVRFRCLLGSTPSSEVPVWVRILQRPWIDVKDSLFPGKLTFKIASDSAGNNNSITGQSFNYCIDTLNAKDCRGTWKNGVKAGDSVSLDTSAKVWVFRQWKNGDSSWVSSSTIRSYTKATLANSGKLSFPTVATESATMRAIYGVQAVSDSLTKTTLSTTSTGAVRIDVTWGAVPEWGAYAEIHVPFDLKGSTVDFSQVTSVTFKYETSDAKTTVLVAPESKAYPSFTSKTSVRMTAALLASTAGTIKTVALPSGIVYLKWMNDQHPDETTMAWTDVQHSIPYLIFQPMPLYNGTGDAVTVPTSWLEISDIQLNLASGATLPLAEGTLP